MLLQGAEGRNGHIKLCMYVSVCLVHIYVRTYDCLIGRERLIFSDQMFS